MKPDLENGTKKSRVDQTWFRRQSEKVASTRFWMSRLFRVGGVLVEFLTRRLFD